MSPVLHHWYSVEAAAGTRDARLCLLRALSKAFSGSQDGLNGVTHIIVDEVHERSVETDFLLAILKRMLPSYPHVKVTCYL